MSYKLDKKKQVGIYGYTTNGINIKNYLEQNGFTNIIFIDKHVLLGEIDVKIYSPDQIAYGAEKDITIIISLQNAISHQNVAEFFFDAGINRVIFLPASIRGITIQINNMRKLYNHLLACAFKFDESIPFYNELLPTYSIQLENGIISQDNVETTFWMKIQNIFVNNLVNQVIPEYLKYYGRSLAAVVHYQDLFSYLERGNVGKNLQEYLAGQKYLDEQENFSREKVLDRYQLWYMYKQELNRGMDFFISSAPKVIMNERGGLNVVDGLHRCVFLYLHNLTYIPVKMDTNEFILRYKTEALNNIIDFMSQNEVTNTVTPIEHPAFYNFPCEKEGVEPSVMRAIQKYIGVNIIEQLSILDISDYNSYFARYMSKMKLRGEKGKIVAVETKWKEYHFSKLLNNLLGINDIEVKHIQDLIELQESFDIVFVMGNSKKYKKSDNYLQLLNKRTKHTLFWETEDNLEVVERIMKKMEFSSVEMIMQYCNGVTINKVFALNK